MFKRIILALAVILPMSVFAQKFGVVNLENVFSAMPETKTMNNQLQEASDKYKAEFQQLREEIDKLVAAYQEIEGDANVPENIKQRRISDIQERQEKANQFASTAQQDLTRLEQQLLAPIQSKITEAIQAVGQEGGFTFIFPDEQQLLLYQGSTVVNVTEDVKAKLGLK